LSYEGDQKYEDKMCRKKISVEVYQVVN
jgi:hypothetical protein